MRSWFNEDDDHDLARKRDILIKQNPEYREEVENIL